MRDLSYKYRILILDFGSQYSQLLAKQIRDFGVDCKLKEWSIKKSKIIQFNPNGIILSGGPESSIETDSPKVSKYIFTAGVPILGICYGMQIMAIQLGGTVKNVMSKREFGNVKVKINKQICPLLEEIKDYTNSKGKSILNVWMSHSDQVTSLPKGFINVASTENCPFTIMFDEKRKFYGVQFHPEVTHTIQGKNILNKFIFKICNCKNTWKSVNFIDNIVKKIRKKVKNDRVFLAFSGGIDSSVSAILLQRAIGSKLTCIFIDNGLLRINESNEIIKIFKKNFNLNIIQISAEKRFFKSLVGVTDPEHKRKIIGKTFIEIFHEQAIKFKGIKWLAQGTICSDVIESSFSVSGLAHKIKSHHNVGGLPKKTKIKIIEPLKELFKDEVKKIGKYLKLPKEIMERHPFPGPGLSIRIIGEVKKEYCDLLRKVDLIFIEELKKSNFYNKISQAFSVFLPIKSVGIMGDQRNYEWVVSLRAIETIDFMTAKWAFLPHEFIDYVSTRIINEVSGISRVVYDISNKPPATIEWE